MTTEAGRVMLERFRVPEWAMFRSLVSGDIAAIEAEARAALLAELEAGVRDIPAIYHHAGGGSDDWTDTGTITRAAVLDLIRKAGK